MIQICSFYLIQVFRTYIKDTEVQKTSLAGASASAPVATVTSLQITEIKETGRTSHLFCAKVFYSYLPSNSRKQNFTNLQQDTVKLTDIADTNVVIFTLKERKSSIKKREQNILLINEQSSRKLLDITQKFFPLINFQNLPPLKGTFKSLAVFTIDHCTMQSL